jgi:hypothetical protein
MVIVDAGDYDAIYLHHDLTFDKLLDPGELCLKDPLACLKPGKSIAAMPHELIDPSANLRIYGTYSNGNVAYGEFRNGISVLWKGQAVSRQAEQHRRVADPNKP